MNIYMPTLVYSEKECVSNHGKEMAAVGEMAMIVTGKHSSKVNGSLKNVTDVLDAEKKPYVIFDDIEENPSVETVMKARNIGIEKKVDFVIGIGGGSPLDASKAIALMIANPDRDESVLYKKENLPYIPVVTVPTTAGTGSEVTPYAILTIHKEHTKKSISHRIYPQMALIDYTYLKTARSDVLINTAIDALAHLVESYLNTNANSLNRMYSRQGMMMFADVKDRLVKPDDEVFKVLSDIAMIAGMAITHTGTSLPHGLSYMITYELGMPHGKAVGIYLPGYIRLYEDKNEAKKVLGYMGFSDEEEFAKYMDELLGKPDIALEISKNNAKLLFNNADKLKNYPYKVTEEQLINIL